MSDLETLQAIVDLAPCAVFELDLEGKIVFLNATAAALIEVTDPVDTTGLNIAHLAVVEDRERVQQAVQEAAEFHRITRVRFTQDLPAPRRAMDLQINGSRAGQLHRLVAVATHASAEEDLLSHIEISPLPTNITRLSDGAVLSVNDAFVEVTGTPREQLIGSNVAAMWRDPSRRDAVIRTLEGMGSVVGEEAIFRDAHGRERIALLSGRSMRLHGEIVVVWQAVDITDQRELEDRLQQLDRLESLAIMAGGVAHDFNNLLMALLGHLEIARGRVSDRQAQRALDRARTAAQRSAELTRQLLDYAGAGAPERESVVVDDIVTDVVELLSGSHPGVEIVQIEGIPNVVRATATHVRQILMNLVANAGQASADAGGSTVLIRSSFYDLVEPEPGWLPTPEPGAYCLIEVIDDGSGFTPVSASRAFEPFFTTRTGGRGLGLASVLGLVRRHRGAVRVVLGGAGQVQVLLPLWRDPTLDELPEALLVREHGRVLVIDDEADVRGAVVEMAREGGWEVLEAGTVADAEGLLAKTAFDVVVLDVRMPDVTGAEGLERVRAAAEGVPIVMMSGFVNPGVRKALRGVGFSYFLEKPFSGIALRAVLADARGQKN